MKRISEIELKQIAHKIAVDWVSRHSYKNAVRLSIEIRRIFKNKDYKFVIKQ